MMNQIFRTAILGYDGARYALKLPEDYGLANVTRKDSLANKGIAAWDMTLGPESARPNPGWSLPKTYIVYLHGKDGDRSDRIDIYNIFREMQYCVLAIDYRGCGDSHRPPNDIRCETSMVEDGMVSVEWLRDYGDKKTKVILWGHSHGAAIAAEVAAKLEERRPGMINGLVLEAPYSSMEEEVKNLPQTAWLGSLLDIKSKLKEIDCELDTAKWLQRVKCPVKLLLAKHDPMVGDLGEKLYNKMKEAGMENIYKHVFDYNDTNTEHVDHITISTGQDFKTEVQDFIDQKCKAPTTTTTTTTTTTPTTTT